MTTVNLVAYCGSDLLKNTWVYLKQGDAFTQLRSDADGLLLSTISTDANPEIASFVEPFVAEAPSTVVLGWSRNGLPLPAAVLKLVAQAFTEVKLDLKPENFAPLPDAPIAPNELNTIQAVPMHKVVLPPLPISFEEPVALDLWPMFAEPFPDDYATDGLPQGVALWGGNHHVVSDGDAAAPASVQKRPKDLGVGVRGTVKNGARQVDLYLLNAKGEQLKFRLTSEANALAVDVATIDVKSANGKSTFATRLFVDDPTRFFGLVQLVAVTKQGQTEGWGNVTAMLLGVQIGLCDDHLQSDKGDMPGPPIGPDHERNVIDFTTTAVKGPLPTATIDPNSMTAGAQTTAAKNAAQAALSPHTRARRMVCFPIRADRKRPNARNASGPEESRPEMPLWMAELQLVGFRRDEGQAFIQMRQAELGVDKRAVAIQASFALTLAWRGPDDDLPGPTKNKAKPRNKYSNTSMTFKGTFRGQKPAQQGEDAANSASASAPTVKHDPSAMVLGMIDVEDDGNLKVSNDGPSTAEIDPPYAAALYPVSGRRIPTLWLDQRLRSWGWTANGAVVPTLVLEWQPPVVEAKRNGYTEIMLGGDGKLEVAQINFAGKPVVRPSANPSPPSDTAAGPLLALPTFRVKGDNPPREIVTVLVDAAVEDVAAAHPDAGPVQMLPVEVWKDLAHRLMAHESRGQQFSESVGRQVYAEKTPFQCHGIQSGMPKFGAPAGYGLGQHDPPRSHQDMWNFYEHIRLGIEELIFTRYGKSAYDYLTGLCPLSATNRLDKAIFLRETVRGYNGGREFVYENGQWKMSPWVVSEGKHVSIPAKRRQYANRALGTTVRYPHSVATSENIADLVGDDLRHLL
jgi:hypothetical protein